MIFIFYALIIHNLNPAFVDKLSCVSHPLEYSIVKTRVSDPEYVVDKSNNDLVDKLFGKGVGVKSTLYRINELSPSLSDYKTFLEIDNGFYYVYHRADFLGLFLFLVAHFCLMAVCNNRKAVLMFTLL